MKLTVTRLVVGLLVATALSAHADEKLLVISLDPFVAIPSCQTCQGEEATSERCLDDCPIPARLPLVRFTWANQISVPAPGIDPPDDWSVLCSDIDFYATTEPSWTCLRFGTCTSGNSYGQIGSRLYSVGPLLGYVHTPRRFQPPGTVPLYSWFNSTTNDHLLTSDPVWRGAPGDTKDGFTFERLEGYVLESAAPDSVRLVTQLSAVFADDAPALNGRFGIGMADYQNVRAEGWLVGPGTPGGARCKNSSPDRVFDNAVVITEPFPIALWLVQPGDALAIAGSGQYCRWNTCITDPNMQGPGYNGFSSMNSDWGLGISVNLGARMWVHGFGDVAKPETPGYDIRSGFSCIEFTSTTNAPLNVSLGVRGASSSYTRGPNVDPLARDGFLRHLIGAILAPGGVDGEAERRSRAVLLEAKDGRGAQALEGRHARRGLARSRRHSRQAV